MELIFIKIYNPVLANLISPFFQNISIRFPNSASPPPNQPSPFHPLLNTHTPGLIRIRRFVSPSILHSCVQVVQVQVVIHPNSSSSINSSLARITRTDHSPSSFHLIRTLAEISREFNGIVVVVGSLLAAAASVAGSRASYHAVGIEFAAVCMYCTPCVPLSFVNYPFRLRSLPLPPPFSITKFSPHTQLQILGPILLQA